MEDDNGGIVGVDIVAGTQTDILVWFLVELRMIKDGIGSKNSVIMLTVGYKIPF